MERPTVKSNLDEVLGSANEIVEEVAEDFVEEITQSDHLPSYQLTRWAWLNVWLAKTDQVTRGRAGVVQRFSSFFFIGGSTSLLNLLILFLVLSYVPLPFALPVRNFIASALGCEISLLANFALNDYFTFRHLQGRQRTLMQRLARFHATALGGIALTILLQSLLTNGLHVGSLLAQAIAILIVMFYNFSFHHFFTYRHLHK